MKGITFLFIQTEETPNPAALKFLPGCKVMESGVMEFTSPDSAWCSPLVEGFFEIPGVCGVFLGPDFITISKAPDVDWALLKPSILTTIMEYFMTHEHVEIKSAPPVLSTLSDEDSAVV